MTVVRERQRADISIGMAGARHGWTDGRCSVDGADSHTLKRQISEVCLAVLKMQKCRLHHYALGFASERD